MTNSINRIRHDYQPVFDTFLHPVDFQSTQTPGGFVHHGYGASYKIDSTNFFADAINRDRTNDWHSGHWPSSPCFHMRTDFSKVGFYQDYTTYNGYTQSFDRNGRPPLISGRGTFFDYGNSFCAIIGHPDFLVPDWGFRIPGSLRSDLSEEAFNYFSDVFPTKLSFAEFVQGFIEMKSLLPSMQDSIVKTIGGGYLNKTFGWDNLLSDLDTLGSICHDVIARMDFFHKTYGIPTRHGFSRSDVWQPSTSLVGSFAYDQSINDYGIWSNRLRLHSYKADFRATAWIMQTLDYVRDLAGFIRTMIGALGLNNPVKAFWNTVPLSFVVDWFFNVSQHLDHLTRLNPAVGWDVTNMTNSVSYHLVWRVCQIGYPGTSSSEQIGPDYFIDQWIYERGVGLSFSWELLNPEELSTSQLTLLLAMLHQLG